MSALMIPVNVFLEQKYGNPYLKFSQYLTIASKPFSAAFFLIFWASVFFYNISSPLNHSNHIRYEIKNKTKYQRINQGIFLGLCLVLHWWFSTHLLKLIKQKTVCVSNTGTDCKFGVFLVDEECHCVHFSLGIIQSTKWLSTIPSSPPRFLVVTWHGFWNCPMSNKSTTVIVLSVL